MAALEIAGKLHLVDGDEGDIGLLWHGFDGTDRIARLGRGDLLFAGHQRDMGGADLLDHPLIDFAGKQSQRQSDDARGMGGHALDCEMGLSGIGRSQNGSHTPTREDQRLTFIC